MTKNGVKEPPLAPLDQRIAAVLAEPQGRASVEFEEFLSEIDAALVEADQNAHTAREKSLDPLCSNSTAERTKALDFEFAATRMRAAIEPLTAHCRAAMASERVAAWTVDADGVELEAARLADELLEAYPAACTVLGDIFRRVRALDRRISNLNVSAPLGVMRRLRDVELVARNISTFIQGDVSVVEKCQLPALLVGRHGAEQLWPPQQNIGLALFAATYPGGASNMESEFGRYHEPYFDTECGHYRMRLKPGVTLPQRPEAPQIMTETERASLEEQQRAAASAKHIAQGVERERGAERLRAEAKERADFREAERRRLEAGAI